MSSLSLFLAAFAYAAPLVVVDPGHGGPAAGAKTAAGVEEKAIVLGVSMHLQHALKKHNLQVVLTREDDRDVALPARILLANRQRAAVFVSIHANSAPVAARRGAETYILSVAPSDEEAKLVAMMENGGAPDDVLFERDPDQSDLAFILEDLERAVAHEGSAKLAQSIQENLANIEASSPSRGLRQAPFVVLRGAKMPAVLVEIGYLTNPAQAELLADPEHQKEIGHAIAKGIVAFLARRK